MMDYIKNLWHSDWIMINKKLIPLVVAGIALYYFYQYSFNKGAAAMYQYISSQQEGSATRMDDKA